MKILIELDITTPEGIYDKATQVTDDIEELIKTQGSVFWKVIRIKSEILD